MLLSTTQAMKSKGNCKGGDAPKISGCILRKAGLISKPLLSAAALIVAAIALFGFAAQSQAQSPTASKGQGYRRHLARHAARRQRPAQRGQDLKGRRRIQGGLLFSIDQRVETA